MLGLLDQTSKRAANADDGSSAASEFEMVVGRRQVASWLFLIIMLLGVASTLAYLAGKMTASASAHTAAGLHATATSVVKPADPAVTPASTQGAASTEETPNANAAKGNLPADIQATPAVNAPNPAAPAVTTPLPQATIVNAPFAAMKKPSADPEPPLFQEPKQGAVYLQMGAVEHGMAMILAEGLRKHGFDALVAPGPREKIFRVLIGPLPDRESFARAKAEVDAMELGTFARKYQQ